MMGHCIAYSASTKINRSDFGLTFNMLLDGKFVVSDEIPIEIEGELVELAANVRGFESAGTRSLPFERLL
jgi:hypothetical protein